jgi:ABC-type antimicrobial peptide transport system permease subunit
MLLGLIILALNLEHFFELAVVHSFFFWDSAAIRNLVLKNLVAHRLRNRKTTMMYALSLGFIIFVNVAYNIEIATFKYQQQQSHGSLLLVEGGPSDSILKKIYSIKQSKPYLEGLKEQWGPEYIEDFAWVTYDIRDCLFDAKGLEISNVGQLYQYRTYLYGISSNFFRASLNQFLAVESSNEKIYAGADDYIAEALYKRESSYRGLVGSLFKQNLALTAESEFLINIYQSNERNLDGVNRMTSHRLKPLAFLDSAPRFTFSPFPQFTTQDVLVSMPTFMRLLNGTYASIDDLPLRFFLIKLADGISDDMLDKLIVDVKGSSIDDGLSVWDYRSTLKPFQVASDAMSYFFNFTTIIAMAVSFFSLMSSMFTNIYEQTKEIGVLRFVEPDTVCECFLMTRGCIYAAQWESEKDGCIVSTSMRPSLSCYRRPLWESSSA